jgi:hypothetical protein
LRREWEWSMSFGMAKFDELRNGNGR